MFTVDQATTEGSEKYLHKPLTNINNTVNVFVMNKNPSKTKLRVTVKNTKHTHIIIGGKTIERKQNPSNLG